MILQVGGYHARVRGFGQISKLLTQSHGTNRVKDRVNVLSYKVLGIQNSQFPAKNTESLVHIRLNVEAKIARTNVRCEKIRGKVVLTGEGCRKCLRRSLRSLIGPGIVRPSRWSRELAQGVQMTRRETSKAACNKQALFLARAK